MFNGFMDSGEAGTAAKKSITLMVSVAIHVALIVSAITLPLLFPDTVSGSIQRLSFLVTPPRPPAPPPAAPAKATAGRIPRTVVEDALQAPVEIPQEIFSGMDEAPPLDSLVAGISRGVPGGVPGGIIDGIIGGEPASMDPLPLPPAPPRAKPPQRVRVGGSVQHAKLIRQVRPRYPPLAQQSRIQGTVILEATISELGLAEDLRVIKGHPLLTERALEAVGQWRYKPTVLNGMPVRVVTRITVRFNLA